MKNRKLPKSATIPVLLALVLIFCGGLLGTNVFFQARELISMQNPSQILQDLLITCVFSGMLSGCLLTAGMGLLGIPLYRHFLHVYREEDALRKKNQTMEELNRQTQKLAHHQRLEIIGTLTASIAHEFNNLLTPIMGNSMMALEKLPSDEDLLYDDLLEIYTVSCRAKELISRLSDLSRKNTETCFRQVAPDEVIRKMVRTAEPARPENVQINMNLNCWDQRLTANELQLSQMILNLILNGFHAMESGGGILTLSTSFDERNIQIEISDTGCGIPGEIQSKIFEPFFTTKETGKGTGLGLAIVAQVVEDHHGKIKLTSEERTGTTFFVSLPRVHEPDIQ